MMRISLVDREEPRTPPHRSRSRDQRVIQIHGPFGALIRYRLPSGRKVEHRAIVQTLSATSCAMLVDPPIAPGTRVWIMLRLAMRLEGTERVPRIALTGIVSDENSLPLPLTRIQFLAHRFL